MNDLLQVLFFGMATGFVYLGEIYGGWRAAKYYQIQKQDAKENSFQMAE